MRRIFFIALLIAAPSLAWAGSTGGFAYPPVAIGGSGVIVGNDIVIGGPNLNQIQDSGRQISTIPTLPIPSSEVTVTGTDGDLLCRVGGVVRDCGGGTAAFLSAGSGEGIAIYTGPTAPARINNAPMVMGFATFGYIQTFLSSTLALQPLGNRVELGLDDGIADVSTVQFKVNSDTSVFSSFTTNSASAGNVTLRNRNAANQVVSEVDYQTQNSIGTYLTGVYLSGGLFSWTSGAEQGDLDIGVLVSGTKHVVLAVRGDAPGLINDSDNSYNIGLVNDRWAAGYFGELVASGTVLPTQAVGTLGIGGIAATPTMGGSGEGDVYLTAAGGLVLIGDGSSFDMLFKNSNGTSVCDISHGSVLISCSGFNATFSTITPNGIYLPSANTLGFSANSTQEMTLTTSALTILPVTVTLTNVTTGTPAASLCLDASNNIIKKTTTGSCI